MNLSIAPASRSRSGLVAGLVFAWTTLSAAPLGSAISGEWEGAFDYLGDVSYARMHISVDGDRMSGKLNRLFEGVRAQNGNLVNRLRAQKKLHSTS